MEDRLLRDGVGRPGINGQVRAPNQFEHMAGIWSSVGFDLEQDILTGSVNQVQVSEVQVPVTDLVHKFGDHLMGIKFCAPPSLQPLGRSVPKRQSY